MFLSRHPATHWHCLLGTVLALALGLGSPVRAQVTDTTPEQARLTAALRQLDVIDQLVAQEATRPREPRARYHFDYARLIADLNRVRAGIRDYLTPQRAQPRDPVELLGDYRQSDAHADGNGPS